MRGQRVVSTPNGASRLPPYLVYAMLAHTHGAPRPHHCPRLRTDIHGDGHEYRIDPVTSSLRVRHDRKCRQTPWQRLKTLASHRDRMSGSPKR